MLSGCNVIQGIELNGEFSRHLYFVMNTLLGVVMIVFILKQPNMNCMNFMSI